ncbi:MAG: arylsulfatase [Planctomycetes bacterium]|nr:arylsulfatase [Planctomycetota bacterium]
MCAILSCGLLVSLSPVLAAAATPKQNRPSIVYILCDDLGYGDLKCLNPDGKIATPRCDQMARDGMRFTDAHSGSAVCTPTRYGVMTGRYSWRTPLQSGVLGGLSPRLIEPGRVTVASYLKQHGYHTCCVGKWHLGMDWTVLPGKEITKLNIETPDQVHNVDYAKGTTNGPTSVGFDRYFGIASSLDMVPYAFIENNHLTQPIATDKSFAMMLGREGRATRLGPAAADFDAVDVLPTLTREAVAYIDQCAADARDGKPFFLYLPLASPHTPIHPAKQWREKSGLNPYADFVMQTDATVGAVFDTLDKHGLTRDTLVILTSDNGCSPQADFPELLAKQHNPSYHFRGTKADIYEGGHRVPLLVHWPARVKAGSASDRITCLTDLLATCAEIVGTPLPASAGEDSESMLAAMTGESAGAQRQAAVVHHSINGSFAIRDGKWKLCLCPGSGGWSAPRPNIDDASKLPLVQLFDLSTDIGERNNLEGEQPDQVKRLTTLLEDFVAQGRSTPGTAQLNTFEPDIWAAGKKAHQPLPPKPKQRKPQAS